MIRVGINGFGRIGRNFLRAFYDNKKYQSVFQVVAINTGKSAFDLAAHLFLYDSILGQYHGSVSIDRNQLMIDTTSIILLQTTTILKDMWKDHQIEWVIDCSGSYTNGFHAQRHISEGGAKKVIISAPADHEDCSIVMGVNDHAYKPDDHHIISMTSCTTNAAVPILAVINDEYGICQGSVKTIHAYTNSQVLLDNDIHDFRRSRSAVSNIIPTTSGFFKTIEKIVPSLAGKLSGLSVRVPIANVSFIDVLVKIQSKQSADSINQLFLSDTIKRRFEGIIGLETGKLVSSDFLKNHHSVVIDTSLTQSNIDWINIFGWYDNEWAYSKRICDFLSKYGNLKSKPLIDNLKQ